MSWTHLRDERPKARKAYRCFLCGEPIPVGEVHVSRAGVRDDGLETFRMHIECKAESDNWDPFDWECFSQGDMERPKSANLKPRKDPDHGDRMA